jgi:OFA family oxalate/formate antiporter-like MFS transporter
MLYTAKGTASLLIPLANVLTVATGSWHAVFYVAAILNIVAAVMALAVLKPMRIRIMGLAESHPVAATALGSLDRSRS